MSDNTSIGTESLEDLLRLQYSWLPQGALDVFIQSYIEFGPDGAWESVRQDERYESWFPGNLTDEGQARYSESDYFAVRESYRDVMRSVGIEPTRIAALEERFIQLMEGEVSPNEFAQRVNVVNDRILSASTQIREYYAEQNGLDDLTTEDLLLGALDPELGTEILERGLRVAEIGGSAREFDFDIDAAQALEIAERGVGLPQARQIFGEANQLVPVLDVLAKRHADPDDDFDLDEFLAADLFRDPKANLRMRRLIQQERASFGRGADVMRDSAGRAEGLTAR